MASLVQFSYIVALDTYRHFVTAAEKCFVSQPTLSMQIKKLEDELEVIIFDRSKQPVMPTMIGAKVIAQARQILAEYNRIEAIVLEEKKQVKGTLIIGIIPTLAPYLLPLFIGGFVKQYPDLEVKIIELLSVEIIEYLEKDRIDVGLLVTPLAHPGIIEWPLFFEEMLIYTHPQHAIYAQNKIEIEAMNTSDIWLLTEGNCFRSQVINLCSFMEENTSSLSYESGSIETLRKLVDKEGGFTLIPELASLDIASSKLNQIKHFNKPIPLREVSMVFSRRYTKEKTLKLLKKSIQAIVPQEMLNAKRGRIVEWK